ncbi:MAG: D-aminopeptidase [Chlamydiae bacterium]|nr:D-aminopeptidase [Chlamydiota bacterium]
MYIYIQLSQTLHKLVYPKLILAFLLISLLLTLNSNELYANPPTISENMDLFIEDVLQQFSIPGASIGVVQGGKIVYKKTYGFRDVAQKLPVTFDTQFALGSCTKAFTALICAQLAEEGRFDLDEKVTQYIPEFRFENLTIRDLIAHRTGVPRNDPIWFYYNLSQQEVVKILDNLEGLEELTQSYQYNNYMYSVLGILIERITGQSWESNVALRIFEPLAMDCSTAELKTLKLAQDHALPYAETNNIVTQIPFREMYAIRPAGGLFSSLNDVLSWLNYHLSQNKSEALLSKDLLSETHKGQIEFINPVNSEKAQYALGWLISDCQGHENIWHDGLIDGFYSKISFFPEDSMGFVILVNNSSSGYFAATYIGNYISEQYLGLNLSDCQQKLLKQRKALKTHIESQKFQDSKLSNPTPYLGSYSHPAYGDIYIKQKESFLELTYGHSSMILYPECSDRFALKVTPLEIFGFPSKLEVSFKRSRDHEISSLEVPFEAMRGAKPITFVKSH